MKPFLVKQVVKILRETADKLDTGNCELSSQEAEDILNLLAHEAMSKEQASSFLNMSRSKFDSLVKDKILPKGKKRRGYKELVWYKDELITF